MNHDVTPIHGDVTLGIDIGTSGTKLTCIDASGTVLFELTSGHETQYPQAGWAEQDAEHDWWQSTAKLIRTASTRIAGEIRAIGISGLGPCLLPVDRAGLPLRNAILYGVDNRAARQVQALTEKYTDESLQEWCAHSLSSESVGPKITWLQEIEPEIWRDTAQLHTSHTHVIHRLTGAYVLDHSSASLWDPLYDPWENAWNIALAREFGVDTVLPDLKWPEEIVGYVTEEASLITGVNAGTPVIAGAIDFAAEFAGVGAENIGDGAITYGTTLVVNVVVDTVVPGREIWTSVGLRPGQHLLGGVTSCAGALTSWIRRLTGNPSYEELIDLANATPIGSNGLLVLPYFSGERTPIFDPNARGVITGLTLSHGVGELYRAGLESQGLALRHILEALSSHAGVSPRTFTASGGGTRHELALQIVSDCTGVSQSIAPTTSGAPYGVALLALRAVSHTLTPSVRHQTAKHIAPKLENSGIYDELYKLYRELDHGTRETNHKLGALSNS